MELGLGVRILLLRLLVLLQLSRGRVRHDAKLGGRRGLRIVGSLAGRLVDLLSRDRSRRVSVGVGVAWSAGKVRLLLERTCDEACLRRRLSEQVRAVGGRGPAECPRVREAVVVRAVARDRRR